ncbi:MAG TPA: DUF4832 domain-containing protein [Bryobacteraceae bacterium]|nr:DUF4832 domain-containing protein [Bryobacteraceae bacterium]
MGLRRLVFVLTLARLIAAQTTVVHPRLIDNILVNPGMGIQTFQRYNGDALNEGVKWSEEGPIETPVAPQNPVDFPKSTISYCRWFWETIEPEQGKVRWEILDRALSDAAKHGQQLAIRLMPYDQKHALPVWYQKSGAKRINREGEKIWEPDFSDPLYLKYWGALVKEAGRRYDGNPNLDTVDISSVGYWGEGWSDFMPAWQVEKKLIDIWIAAFPTTHLLMNFDEPEALHYGTQHGAGWRFDCVGDMRANWAHMLDFYPMQIVRAGIEDVWKQEPVSMETCGVPESWKRSGWDVHYILREALRWHVTSLNVKSSAIPADWKSAFDEFQKRMGYRLELRRFEYPTTVRSSSEMAIKMWWVNSGVAPVYRPYTVAVSIADQVMEVPADLRKWLPGDALVEETIPLPAIAPGEHRIRVALLDPRTRQPAIQLGIAGRANDGWYDLGSITVN